MVRNRGDRDGRAPYGPPVNGLRLIGDLEPPRSDDLLLDVTVGPDGSAVTVWTDPATRDQARARETAPSGVTFPATTTELYDLRVRSYGHRPGPVVTLRDVRLAHPMIAPLPGGRTLLVGARCAWSPDGPERNAAVHDRSGRLLRTGTLGDGVAAVATTRSGRIWVSYFDEGIYGNFGWNGPGPPPLGRSGLAAFGSTLEREWEFPVGPPPIDDCSALNVVDETVWACYYSDHPVVRVHEGKVTVWTTDRQGAGAVLADGARAALVFARPESGGITAGDLRDGRFVVRSADRVPGIGPGSRLVARGPRLHVFDGPRWSVLDL